MNIAILGGSFDPPHIWHYWTSQQILENVRGIDQVWYMPDYANALKPVVAAVSDRMEMLKFISISPEMKRRLSPHFPISYSRKSIRLWTETDGWEEL